MGRQRDHLPVSLGDEWHQVTWHAWSVRRTYAVRLARFLQGSFLWRAARYFRTFRGPGFRVVQKSTPVGRLAHLEAGTPWMETLPSCGGFHHYESRQEQPTFFLRADDDKHGIAQMKSTQKEIGLNVGLDDARPTARRTPGARGPMSTSQILARARRGTTRSSFAAGEPGSFQAERNLQETHKQCEEGDEDARPTRAVGHPQPRPCLRARGRIRDREPEDWVQVDADVAAQW